MVAQPELSVALIGCGKMGSALLRGWLSSPAIKHIYILDPIGLPDEFEDFVPDRITFFDKPALFAGAHPKVSVFVVAVKPQILEEVCQEIKRTVSKDALVLSIAAGQKIANFEKIFGAEQPVIRSMPNTPAAIGQGITVACANSPTQDQQRKTATQLLQAVGMVEWISDENQMDAVTALSGSGPAYIFLLIEALAAAGVKNGLPADFSMKIARQTVIGSAALAQEDHSPVAQLRQNVTSPGGTTAAALAVLMREDGIQKLFDEALSAATKRSQELSA